MKRKQIFICRKKNNNKYGALNATKFTLRTTAILGSSRWRFITLSRRLHCTCATHLVHALRFHNVRTALTACRQNGKEVLVICRFARAISICSNLLARGLQPWPDSTRSTSLAPPTPSSLPSYASIVTSILDVVDLCIFKDLICLHIVSSSNPARWLVFDMHRK